MVRGAGFSLSDIQAVEGYSYQDLLRVAQNLGIPAFAGGGDHAGGPAIVGEKGPELINLPPARIYTAPQTANMLGGSADMKALAAEVRSLKSVVERQELALANISMNTGNAATTLRGEDGPIRTKAVA